MTAKISGTEPGQRRLNGPQTTGRDYRNLSSPEHELARDDDVAVPMRDGVTLLADVHRPATPGRTGTATRPTRSATASAGRCPYRPGPWRRSR